jgi:hypothetical protein
MSVLSYFQTLSSSAVLSTDENNSIARSISTLSTRLDSHFGNNLKRHVHFGSSVRGTILPRSMDEYSDIDYMIVFAANDATPQTYLNRLKAFAEKYYSTSETKQSSPTILLELNHIKFDLVPATESMWGTLQIPNGTGGWRETDPVGFSQKLEEANKRHNSVLKPAIRLMKYWNARRGYVFESFSLEKWMTGHGYWSCANVRDYLFHAFDQLSSNNSNTQNGKDSIDRAKSLVASIREYERKQQAAEAEREARRLLPAV